MNKQQLANKIWASANKMRSKIEANEYKDYILGFIFYKFLSEKEVKFAMDNELQEDQLSQLVESDADTVKWVQDNIGYFISYENLYSTWIGNQKEFSISNVRDALSAFSRLISPHHKKVFEGIFDTLQEGLKKLGSTDAEQTTAVRDLLFLIKDIPMDGRQDYDVLGFIYEYLISQFAANAGKKAGEFYTPHEVSMLMSDIVAYHLKDRDKIEIYDPTSGSGSLLINIGKSVSRHIEGNDSVKYFAQELKKNTFNLTRMNLVMRGIIPDNIITRNGDTLAEDWPYFDENDKEGTYNPLFVDAVVSNPPYSQSWTPPSKPKAGIQGDNDPRFGYGIAPKGKADYAFLLHDLYHLRNDGIMTIVLPHGVLFRGDAGNIEAGNEGDMSEGTIRRQLIENNNIDAIIGLPADIFFGTGIPTIVIVLRKHRVESNVLIIDASRGYVKEGKKNKLRASDIKRIVDTYIDRKDVAKFSRVVDKEEIRRNGYNLNIPRYINSSDENDIWDMYATMFGGLPKSELDRLRDYWNAFPQLYDVLFNKTETPYTSLKVDNLSESIKSHSSVESFVDSYNNAFDSFSDFLHKRLFDEMMSLNISQEIIQITSHIFSSLKNIPLIDRFEAYQLFADKWITIAQDLEIIQTEGFEATRVVDANMIIKKKDDKEYEEQNGWVGHILPFELVQTTFLKDEWQAICDAENRLEEATSDIETTLGRLVEEDKEAITNDDDILSPKDLDVKLQELLADVETSEINDLEEYLSCTKKKEKVVYIESHPEVNWKSMETSKDGTYSAKNVKAYISLLRNNYPFEEGALEAQLIKLSSLNSEIKELKSTIKVSKIALHEHIKDVIENELSDQDIYDLLSMKWIDTLCDHLLQLPHTVIDEFTSKLIGISKKYETTLVEVEQDIQEASQSLSLMIDELTGNEYDMVALAEFKKLLQNE